MKTLMLALLVAATGVATPASAQDYPAHPVKLVVPYAAGGLPDTMARVAGQKVGDALGQSFVVDNRGGAGGIVGTEAVAKSPPDGYTLLVADVAQIAINPHLYATLPYDGLKDFAPVSLMGIAPLFLVANPSLPVNNLRELVDYVRANPGKVSYGSSGIGSIHHLSMEAFKHAFGLNMIHVPYKGTGQSVPALLGGQVSLLFSAGPSIMQHWKAGKLKVLAVNSAKRSPQAPDVPTIAESGVPGFDYPAEIGVLAPAGTPAPVVARLSAEFAKAVKQPDVAERFAALGIDPVGSTAEAYAAHNREAYKKYEAVVKQSGARVE